MKQAAREKYMAEIEGYRQAAVAELRAGSEDRLKRGAELHPRFEAQNQELTREFESRIRKAAAAEASAKEAHRKAREERERIEHERAQRKAALDKAQDEELRPFREEADASRQKVAGELETKLKQAKQRYERALEGLPKHT